MPRNLLIGSGPAAAGVALALARDPSQQIVVLDIGGALDPELSDIKARLAVTPEDRWSAADLLEVSQLPVIGRRGELPEKRAYGSNFPFRNLGQLDGVSASGGANSAVVSGAFGGFSNVWGAQITPFTSATFDDWPFSAEAIEPSYQEAAKEMSLAGEDDDLSTYFPLHAGAQPLPPLSSRANAALARYERRRATVQSHGITVGRARLALQASGCTRCGLCLTGCPYSLIYSASQTIARLTALGRVTHHRGLMAVRINEEHGLPTVIARDIVTARERLFEADRVFVGCGGIGTTRLVVSSTLGGSRRVSLGESAQFILPVMSTSKSQRTTAEKNFTLNQFNLVFDATGERRELSQIHFYPYNRSYLDALPRVFARAPTAPWTQAVLRRLSVGLGYLPSWASPRLMATLEPDDEGGLASLTLSREATARWPPMLRQTLAALSRVSRDLDLWPIYPLVALAAGGKSYHYGASFPHADQRSDRASDRLGRLAYWDNVHLVDASVFTTVPATTFTMTVMANAHRIATEAMATNL